MSVNRAHPRADRLGRLGLPLGRLGFGTAPIAGLYEAIDDESAAAVVERAWTAGVRFFDTAPRYGAGLAERRLGAALEGKPRGEFAVSTKVGRLLRPGRTTWHGAPPLVDYFDFSYDAALRSLEESLQRLQLDHVDIGFIHDPDDHYEEAVAGSYAALARLREEGVVRAIGVGMNQAGLLCRFVREVDLDCVLVAGRLTLLDRSAARELTPLCRERGVPVIAAAVFNSGILAGGTTFDYEQAAPGTVARVDQLRRACDRHGVPLAAAALQYPLRDAAVASVLVGCGAPQEVEENVRLLELPLPDELWDELG